MWKIEIRCQKTGKPVLTGLSPLPDKSMLFSDLDFAIMSRIPKKVIPGVCSCDECKHRIFKQDVFELLARKERMRSAKSPLQW